MLFRRFYCDPLAQACYVLADGDEAIVIDPRRDIDDVLAFVAENGLMVRWVVATHVHADFVAGLGEVAAITGARIGLGERFTGRHPCERLADGQQLVIGDQRLRVLSTPGHTTESISLFLPAGPGGPGRLWSGDTLFVGDVGRPDLAQGQGLSPRVMAEQLFTTLRDRIANLPDDTEVWPAHGAGSACGTCITSAPSSTIGAERDTNWALRESDVGRFCDRLLSAHRAPPRHFAEVAATNRDGAPLVASLPALQALDNSQVAQALAAGARILDVRPAPSHGRGHWPGALNLGANGNNFESWAGNLLPPHPRLVLHAANEASAALALQRLRRIGIDDVAGFVTEEPPAPRILPQLDAVDLFAATGGRPWQVIDVRRPDEFAAGHVPGAVHCELATRLDDAVLARLDRTRPTAVICETGYRSSAASQRLRDAGFADVHNVRDGMVGWRTNQMPLEVAAAASVRATS